MFIPKGGIAQLGERGLCKPEARGSNPLTSTNNFESLATAGFFISKEGARGSNPVWGAERSKRASVCRAARKAAQPPQRKERAQRAANPLTSTKNPKASLRRGFFISKEEHGVCSKGPSYRKALPKRRWYPPNRHHSICYDETSEHLGGLHARC